MTRYHWIAGLVVGVLLIAPSIIVAAVFETTGIEPGSWIAVTAGMTLMACVLMGSMLSLFCLFALAEETMWKPHAQPTPQRSNPDPAGITD